MTLIVAARAREQEVRPCPSQPPVVSAVGLRRRVTIVPASAVLGAIVLYRAAAIVHAELAPRAFLVLSQVQRVLDRACIVAEKHVRQLAAAGTVTVVDLDSLGQPARAG